MDNILRILIYVFDRLAVRDFIIELAYENSSKELSSYIFLRGRLPDPFNCRYYSLFNSNFFWLAGDLGIRRNIPKGHKYAFTLVVIISVSFIN